MIKIYFGSPNTTISKEMAKTWKILNFIILGTLILICVLGTFYRHISFGLGLGDIIGYFFFYVGTITHFILTIVFRNKGKLHHISLTLISLVFTVLIALNATIWRGNEYRWNGSIFYLPCPTKIKIENIKVQKEMLVQMCSMQYYSTFTGCWDGKHMVIKKGAVMIPEKLGKYIKHPVSKVLIEPQCYQQFVDNKTTISYYFDKDTLVVNSEYELSGEISAIKGMMPVLKVNISSKDINNSK